MTIRSDKELVDYTKSLDCIHCGLCLHTCPTYRLTGVETSSPRGRIHLMRAVAEERLEADADFADEMNFCLLCRHCESVCPAGVQFGSMMEHARGKLEERAERGPRERFLRWMGFRVLLPKRWALRTFAALGRFGQVTKLDRLAAIALRPLGVDPADAPVIPPASERRALPHTTPARGETRARVAVLEGCVMPVLFGRVNRATAESLSTLGAEVRAPRGAGCCGSLHAHNGDMDEARRLARALVEAFDAERGPDGAALAVVSNSAGCGSHMRELHHLFDEDDPFRERAEAFAARVRDYSEVAAELLEGATGEGGNEARVEPRIEPGELGPVAWDDPCHLCHGQGVRAEPRQVLASIDGLEGVELAEPESCCGSAGIYSILRPEDSRGVLEPKLDALERSGARTLVTGNPGCHLQWETGVRERGAGVQVLHLAEVLARALRV